MTDTTMDPRYPIGKYDPQPFSDNQLKRWLYDIELFPKTLAVAVQNLDEKQYETPYREGGWKIRQLVHHLADSHIIGYTRFKLALTEDAPKIKPYQEKLWAQTDEVENTSPSISITLLSALHARWYELIRNLKKEDWERTIYHPEYEQEFSLWHLLGSYAWHGRHHVAHITNACVNNGWK